MENCRTVSRCWYCRHQGHPRAHYPPTDLLDLEDDWEPVELRCTKHRALFADQADLTHRTWGDDAQDVPF